MGKFSKMVYRLLIKGWEKRLEKHCILADEANDKITKLKKALNEK